MEAIFQNSQIGFKAFNQEAPRYVKYVIDKEQPSTQFLGWHEYI
jgi:hypothetical protein